MPPPNWLLISSAKNPITPIRISNSALAKPTIAAMTTTKGAVPKPLRSTSTSPLSGCQEPRSSRTGPGRSSLAAAKPFQALPHRRIEPVSNATRRRVGVASLHELVEERCRGQLPHLLARDPPHGGVGRHEADDLAAAGLRREPFQNGVRVRRKANGERPDLAVGAGAVEDDDAAGTVQPDEARQGVDDSRGVSEPAGMQKV